MSDNVVTTPALETILCRRCDTDKPIAEFNASALRQRKRVCAACERAYVASYYRRNQEALREKGREYNRRRFEKNPDRERAANRRNAKVRDGRRRVELLAKRSAWRLAHPDLAALIDAEITSQREWKKQRNKDYWRKSPDRIARLNQWVREHPEERREYGRQWRQANRGKCRAYGAKRTAVKAGSRAEHDPEILAFYEFVRTALRLPCYICGRSTKPGERHVDHVKPLSRGGAHVRSNLACACATCNLKKHAKLPEEIGLLPF